MSCGSVDKRKPGPAEGEKAELRQIEAVESSCTAKLNYKLPQQILLAEGEKKKDSNCVYCSLVG